MTALGIPLQNKEQGNTLKENPNQFHKTPPEFALAAIRFMFDQYSNIHMFEGTPRYLDAGAGRNGVWGQCLRQVLTERKMLGSISGVELETCPQPEGYEDWRQADFLSDIMLYGSVFAGAFTNPPFTPSQLFIERMHLYCLHGATIMALLPLNFIAGQRRHLSFFPVHGPTDIYPLGQRVSFSGNGKTDAREYCLAFWKVGYSAPFARTWWNWQWRPATKSLPKPRKFKGKQIPPQIHTTQEELIYEES